MAERQASDAQAQLAKVRHLQQLAELAYTLAHQVHEEVVSLRHFEATELTPVEYSLGIAIGDAEIAANRLGGLRNELGELAKTLNKEVNRLQTLR
jgi:hypothetical protein